MSNDLNFISLFAGGGGLTLGLEAAGFNCVLATDVNPAAATTFRANRPEIPFIESDVRRLTREQMLSVVGRRKVHLIAGGPPCQGFSTLGDQILADARNVLFWSFHRIVRWFMPDCFLMENVNYLRSQYDGRYEQEIVNAFGEHGYRVSVATLNAADYGVPQIRKRVFFVGTRRGHEFVWPKATHSDERTWWTQPYRTVEEAIMDLPTPGDLNAPPNHSALKHSATVIRRYELIPEGGRLPPPSHLPADIRRKNFGNTYKRLHRRRPSLTLVPGNNAFPVHPTEHRSLTPREGARLQTFPDDYEFAGNRAEQCRLVGNAVPVLLAQAIGTALRDHLCSETRNVLETRHPVDVRDHLTLNNMRRKTSKPLTAVSLFTGIGGLLLGFRNAGFKIAASYDRKAIVAKNMAINFPDTKHHHVDLSTVTARQLRKEFEDTPIDVVFGGPPCQGFSIFGKRRFVNTRKHRPDEDPRNELMLKYIELALALKPSVIFMENVKGLMSTPRGNSTYVAVVTARLKRAGYESDWRIVNSADFGVPQLRERSILVAWKRGLEYRWPEPKYHAEPKSWQRRHISVGDVISDLADPTTYSSDFSHVPMAHKPLVVERYKLIPEGGRLPEDKLPTHLRSGYRSDHVKNFSHVYRRLAMDRPATTMVPGHNAFPIHPTLPRALTVREAARIQTLPDAMRFVGTRQQQCTLVGNAVPPLLAEIFAQAIAKTIRGNYADPGYKHDIYELKAQHAGYS